MDPVGVDTTTPSPLKRPISSTLGPLTHEQVQPGDAGHAPLVDHEVVEGEIAVVRRPVRGHDPGLQGGAGVQDVIPLEETIEGRLDPVRV